MLLAQLETPPEVLSTSTPEILPPPEDLAPPMAPQEALLGAGLPVAGSQENIICDFYTPLAIKKVGGQTAKLIYPDQDNANFQFASSSCFVIYPQNSNASSSLYEEITNPASSTQSFFLEKTLTYGDLLIVIFLTLGFYFVLGRSLFNFFLKKWH